LEPRTLARLAVELAKEKKANDVVVLDVRRQTAVTDYFVVCSAPNSIQVRAIADNIEERLEQGGVLPHHREGLASARWILLDYGSVVIHVFREEERAFYNLERLWGQASDAVDLRP